MQGFWLQTLDQNQIRFGGSLAGLTGGGISVRVIIGAGLGEAVEFDQDAYTLEQGGHFDGVLLQDDVLLEDDVLQENRPGMPPGATGLASDQKPDLISSNSATMRSRIAGSMGVWARRVVEIGSTSAAVRAAGSIWAIETVLVEA